MLTLASWDGVEGDAYAEARSLCFFCWTSDKCLRWLDEGAPVCDGNISKAARGLDMSRATLHRKLKQLGFNR